MEVDNLFFLETIIFKVRNYHLRWTSPRSFFERLMEHRCACFCGVKRGSTGSNLILSTSSNGKFVPVLKLSSFCRFFIFFSSHLFLGLVALLKNFNPVSKNFYYVTTLRIISTKQRRQRLNLAL